MIVQEGAIQPAILLARVPVTPPATGPVLKDVMETVMDYVMEFVQMSAQAVVCTHVQECVLENAPRIVR